MTEIFELTTSECETLLRAGVVGRVAILTASGPLIVPMNYGVVDDAVIIRTASDTEIGSHAEGAAFAFEVDQFDYPNGRGWSVLARGVARILHPSELEHVEAVQPPRPWADGPRHVYIRLAWTELSGRRLGRGWDPLRSLPVRRVATFGPRTPDAWRSVDA